MEERLKKCTTKVINSDQNNFVAKKEKKERYVVGCNKIYFEKVRGKCLLKRLLIMCCGFSYQKHSNTFTNLNVMYIMLSG